MSRNNPETIQLIAQYIPNEERVSLLRSLLEIHGSLYKTSKMAGISRQQLYRYLINEKKSYPSDEVTVRILMALIEVKRNWVKDQLRQLDKNFGELINKI